MPSETRRLPRLLAGVLAAAAVCSGGTAWSSGEAPTGGPAAAAATTAAPPQGAAAAERRGEPLPAAALQQKKRSLVEYITQKFSVPESKAFQIVSEAFRSAARNNTHPELILSVIAVESAFKERARNGGAVGLMQVIPRWHRDKIGPGGSRQLYDPAKNIRVGSDILMEYLRKSSGDVREALMRYKGGAGSSYARHYPDKILNNYEKMRAVTESAAPAPQE